MKRRFTKKEICILLIVAFVCCILLLFAINQGNKEERTKKDNIIETTISTTEQTTLSETEIKKQYYDKYLENKDFGFSGSDIHLDLKSDTASITMEVSDSQMIFQLDENILELHEIGDKAYFRMKVAETIDEDTKEKTPAVDTWYVSEKPKDSKSIIKEQSGIIDLSATNKENIKNATYIETIQIDGKSYDKIKLDVIQNEDEMDALETDITKDNTTTTKKETSDADNETVDVIAYVDTSTNKITKMEYTEIQNQTGQEKPTTVNVTITIKDTTSKFTPPKNAKEMSYEDASMSFAFALLTVVMSAGGTV